MPVQRADVEIITDRERVSAAIFLPADFSPEDLFEGDEPFFPADVGGKIRFFARCSVASITLDASDAPPESVETLGLPFDVRAVTVRLRNGTTMAGTLMCAKGRSRTLDFLNQRTKSLALHGDGKVHHIAKGHVDHIEETR